VFHEQPKDIRAFARGADPRSRSRGRLLASTLALLLRPVGVNIDGFARDAVLRLGDSLGLRPRRHPDETAALSVHVLPGGRPMRLEVDESHDSERLLSYAADAVLAKIRRSPLGRHILATFARGAGGFVDIGANLGLYSLLARVAGADNTIVFEPEPRHAAFLARNGAHFDHVYDCALSSRSGPAELHVAVADQPGVSSLSASPGEDIYAGSTVVQARTLDEVVALTPSAGWDRVRLVKIDVEGHEVETVRGMSRFLRDGGCPEVWCEVRGPYSRRAPDTWVDVTMLMHEAGYRPHLCVEAARPSAPWQRRPNVGRVFDMLFVRDSA